MSSNFLKVHLNFSKISSIHIEEAGDNKKFTNLFRFFQEMTRHA